jgi:hypothetical protein
MPKYIVRVSKSEIVMLGADVHVNADSADAARARVQRRIDRGREIDDRLWFETDSNDLKETIKIEDAWLDPQS